MINLNIHHLIRTLKTSQDPVILFGAGKYGKLALYALNKLGIQVKYFCDDDETLSFFQNIPVINSKKINFYENKAHIFICSSYAIEAIFSRLKKMNYEKIYSCINLFENTNYSESYFDDMNFFEISRRIELYKAELASITATKEDILDIKYLDVVITEACSMKCKNCSNLMQYYTKPKNVNLDLLYSSLDKLMKVTNDLYEFRLLGGKPFVNKKIGEIVNKLASYAQAKNIVIYTNATIIPKDDNLECLKNKKVLLDITNYGKLSIKHEEYIKIFKENNIRFTTNIPIWTDSGTINYQKKTEDKLVHMFKNCCVNDILTLLNGKLYRCPFSANIMNLNAIPINQTDFVDLSNENKTIEEIKFEIKNLYKNKKYLSACSYCNGRDYTTPKIKVAIQTKKPLEIPSLTAASKNN